MKNSVVSLTINGSERQMLAAPGATLLGWANGVTNLAKFTFVP